MSIDCYTRLERGKETRPSPAVVDALARALKLNDDEFGEPTVAITLLKAAGVSSTRAFRHHPAARPG